MPPSLVRPPADICRGGRWVAVQPEAAGAMDEHPAQIGVAALCDAAELGPAARGHLPGHKPEPGGEVPTPPTGQAASDGRGEGRRRRAARRGTSPSRAAKPRPPPKAEPSAMAAIMAVATSGPIPGTVISRWQ